MSRTILNINGDSRVINPRNGSAIFVDLLTSQTIAGIKRFLNNLITNSDVNFNTTANIGRIVFKPNEPVGSGKIVAIYTTNQSIGYGWFFDANGNLYYQDNILRIIFYSTGNITCQDISCGSISAASVTCGFILTTSTITAGGKIYANAGLNATTGAFTNNVTITGATTGLSISGGTSGIFTNRIDAFSGGIITCSSQFTTLKAPTISAITSLLSNSLSPYSGTVINIGATSEFNWLKSVGVSRVRFYPTSASGDIMQICRVSDATFTSGYHYFNNTGNFGYNTAGISVWELLNTGAFTNTSTITTTSTSNASILTAGGITCNGSQSTFNSSGIRAIYVPNGKIETFTLLVNDSGNSTISVPNGGVTAYRLFANNYIQCLGQYIYCEHATTGDICGLWSNRTGVGGTVFQNGNSWSVVIGTECNTNGAIGGGGFNNGNIKRQFLWAIENTTGSGKALGLLTNRTDNINATINTATQSTNYALLGYYATNRTGGAYSFTGEHSSMVCDEEYDDLMNYNTDDFIGMVVCSSGKIYNLPYDVDGNTYTKQVDNIKSIDSQPMTRLSKKYKDKSVLGIISHIEVGKNRNDLNATSWTGCMALDKDERRRIRVACIGEGGIWVTNEYGNIENGDYITTSSIAGYATKQDDDLLHNYTIAKATMDCSFDIEKPDDYKTKYLGNNVYASYIACTYHCG